MSSLASVLEENHNGTLSGKGPACFQAFIYSQTHTHIYSQPLPKPGTETFQPEKNLQFKNRSTFQNGITKELWYLIRRLQYIQLHTAKAF